MSSPPLTLLKLSNQIVFNVIQFHTYIFPHYPCFILLSNVTFNKESNLIIIINLEGLSFLLTYFLHRFLSYQL